MKRLPIMIGKFVYECTYTEDDIGMEDKLFIDFKTAKQTLQARLTKFGLDHNIEDYLYDGKAVFVKREVYGQ